MENQLSSSAIFSQDIQRCRFSKRFRTEWQFVKQVQKTLKIESCNDIDWTKIEKYNEYSSNSATIKNYAKKDFRLDIGLFSVHDQWTSSIPSYQCVESRILLKERWNMYDSLQRGTVQFIYGAVANWCDELCERSGIGHTAKLPLSLRSRLCRMFGSRQQQWSVCPWRLWSEAGCRKTRDGQ